MILKNNILILSYSPYEYKDGGFCIVINSDNSTSMTEIDLTEKEISELRKFTLNKNKVTNYLESLNEYFNSLSTDLI